MVIEFTLLRCNQAVSFVAEIALKELVALIAKSTFVFKNFSSGAYMFAHSRTSFRSVLNMNRYFRSNPYSQELHEY